MGYTLTKQILYPITFVVMILMLGVYFQKYSIEKSIYEECIKEMYEDGLRVLTCKMPYGLKDE